MKPVGKKNTSASMEASQSLISLWWKLSVSERKAHFHAITVDLLVPFLFKQNIVEDGVCMAWGRHIQRSWFGGQARTEELMDEDYRLIDVLEHAIGALKEQLSKFDGKTYFDSMIRSMEGIRNCNLDTEAVPNATMVPSFTIALELIHDEDWYKHFSSRSFMNKTFPNAYNFALVFSSMQIFAHINSLHNGEKPLDKWKALTDLNERKISEEKQNANDFFKKKLYDKAIHIYSKIISKKPYCHLIYCNRAECYLKKKEFRLAMADAKRTITLDPTSEKGQFRYCRALEQIGWYDEGIMAVKNALKICPSSGHLKLLWRRIQEKTLGPSNRVHTPALILRDDPPDLVSASSGDESSGGSHSEISDDSFTNEYFFFEYSDDFHEKQADTRPTSLDSDDWYHIDDKHEAFRSRRLVKRNKAMGGNHEISSNLWELQREMEKGTELLLAGKLDDASFFFNLVLNLIRKGKDFSLKREEEVVLIYAYGMCSFLSGSIADLSLAEAQFERIMGDFDDVNFPLAHYRCAQIHQKRSRFPEMQSCLDRALKIIEKSVIVTRKWPGSEFIIEETRPAKLQALIQILLGSAFGASPDAVCKFEGCDKDKRSIFMNELDSKGFFRVKCNESCQIEYHSSCWQKHRKILNFPNQLPLKGFLSKDCLTPDCSGVLTYICYTLLAADSDVRIIEHEIDIPKKSKQEVWKIEKSKRMKPCSSYKKLGAKKILKAEGKRKKQYTGKPVNDDDIAASIQNELSLQKKQDAIVQQHNVSYGDAFGAKSLYVGPESDVYELKKDLIFLSDEFDHQDAGLFDCYDEQITHDSSQIKKKRKKKKKKAVNSATLDEIVGKFEPNNSVVDFAKSGSKADEQKKTIRDTVTDHLHSLFADLLISKGQMDIDSDEDVGHLLSILDTDSASIIISRGGLRDFLALSPTFAFDPDDTNVVYLAEEADIYLLSKKETSGKKNPIFACEDEAGCGYRNEPRGNGLEATRKKSNDILQQDPGGSSVAKTQSRSENGDANSVECQFGKLNDSKRSSKRSMEHLGEAKNGTSKHCIQLNESERKREVPGEVFDAQLADGLQQASIEYQVRREGIDHKVSEKVVTTQTDNGTGYSCKVSESGATTTVDVAVMTSVDWKKYKELYEYEVAEKEILLEKNVEAWDSLEQLKNKLKIEKETAVSREMDLRAALEKTKSKLMKEQSSHANAQRKWEQEKSKLFQQIKMFEDRHGSNKAMVQNQEKEMKRMVEKVGEMKLNEERTKAENADAISKLRSSITEQSKRAQKAEILFVELKKVDTCKSFQRAIEQSQLVIDKIESNPSLEQIVGGISLSWRWNSYKEVMAERMRQSLVQFDKTLQLLKRGISLNETPSIIIVENPPAPPQPEVQLANRSGGRPHLSVTRKSSQSVNPLPPGIKSPISAVPQSSSQETGTTNASSHRNVSTGSEGRRTTPSNANATAGAVAMATSVAVSAASRSVPTNAEKIESAKNGRRNDLKWKTNGTGAAKSSSFEKIMKVLQENFPNHSRDELVTFLKDFREQRNNTLSGLTVEDIIVKISEIIRGRKPHSEKCARGRDLSVKSKLTDVPFGYGEDCVICHDEMVHVDKTTKLQCNHVFHTRCIQRWLTHQRTCPTCRYHTLLPEDFPALNGTHPD